MSIAFRIAWGFAILRGVQLGLLTVPWIRAKVRRPEATESERSLVWMVGSRSILLGLALVVLAVSQRWAPLGWLLLADGLMQLFDAAHAFARGQRALAGLPLALGVLDAAAALALLG